MPDYESLVWIESWWIWFNSCGPCCVVTENLSACNCWSWQGLLITVMLRPKMVKNVGNLPSIWKLATLMPVFKSGSSSLVKNYRPISLTSIFCMLMERVITRQTSLYLLQHGLIFSHQHGFITKLSTTTNLVEKLTDWTITIQTRHSVTVAYIDFCKAFDSVNFY